MVIVVFVVIAVIVVVIQYKYNSVLILLAIVVIAVEPFCSDSRLINNDLFAHIFNTLTPSIHVCHTHHLSKEQGTEYIEYTCMSMHLYKIIFVISILP